MSGINMSVYMGVWNQLWESLLKEEIEPEMAGILLWAITRPEAELGEVDMLADVRDRMGDWAPAINPIKKMALVTVDLEGQRVAELIDLRAKPPWSPNEMTSETMAVFMRALADSAAHLGGVLQQLGPGKTLIGGSGGDALDQLFKAQLHGDKIVEDFRKDIDEIFPTYQPGGGEHDSQ